MKKFQILILVFCFSIPCTGQVKDSLFLNSGQLLIGEIKGVALGKMDFKPDDMDMVSIKTNKIKTINASHHLYKLETIDGKIFYSELRPFSHGQVLLSYLGEWDTLAIDQIRRLSPLLGESGGLWKGNASAGYSYTRSSDIGRFNADLSIGYSARKLEFWGKSSVITTQTKNQFAFENANANLYANYIFDPVWRGIVLFSYQHNLEQGLARRYQEGVAVGRMLQSSTHSQGRIMAGVVLSQEKSSEGISKPLQMELPVIYLFDLYQFNKPDITISTAISLFTGLTEWGRFRQDGQLIVRWKIITDFSITLQLYNNYDNRPPGVNASPLDYGIVFGLGYEFSL